MLSKKSFSADNINEIFKLFYLYYYLLFDNTTELLNESQRIIKKQRLQLEERIKRFENQEKHFNKQIEKYNLAVEEATIEEVKILVKLIAKTEEKQNNNYTDLSKSRIELEQLHQQYSHTTIMSAYYNTKDTITQFFKSNLEEQRDSLIKIIKECLIFEQYIIIDSGTILFVFDTKQKYQFNDEILNDLDKEQIYKTHFIEQLNDNFIDVSDISRKDTIKRKMLKAGKQTIFDCKLKGPNTKVNVLVAKELFENYKITYDFSNHAAILFFIDR